ncbi:N-acetylglucosaminyl deacetylase, LmbE family [Frankineae bacterium MT45]|nr:N-acetylglucosaminyl deacetylase, LmbE family [Frankineae bacterium MT45]
MSTLAPRGRRAARLLLTRRAVDVTRSIGPRSALIVAPHPDDETLGCGGRVLLARRAGAQVTLVVLSDGGASEIADDTDRATLVQTRSAELAVAAERLGVGAADVHELGYPDASLADFLPQIQADLGRLIENVNPDDIYVTCMQEWHADHAAAAVATRSAVEALSHPPRLLEYPIWLWSDWPISRRLINGSGVLQFLMLLGTGRVERISLDGLQTDKRAALAAYASQIGGPRRLDEQDTGTEDAPIGLGPELIARTIAGPELYFRPKLRPLGQRPPIGQRLRRRLGLGGPSNPPPAPPNRRSSAPSDI